MTGFTEDDVRKLREFGSFLNQKASFNDMSIPESAKLISYLQFYNQLAAKVEQNVLEVVTISQPEKSAKKDKKELTMSFGSTGSFSDVADSSYVSTVVTVGTSQVQAKVGASNLANRQELIIFNDSLSTIYYGPSGVTISGSTKGIPIQAGGFVNLPFGFDVAVFVIAGSAGNSIIIQELA